MLMDCCSRYKQDLYLLKIILAMKQTIITLTAAAMLSGCFFDSETGSGNIETQKRNVGNFTTIVAGSAIDVEVKTGPAAVEVEADDNIIQYVKTSVSGNTLHLGIESGVSLRNSHIKIYVTVPELERIEARSSADVKVMDVIKSSKTVRFDVSSSADIEAEVDAPEVETEASSSGSISLSGRTKNYIAKVSSSGEIKAFDLMSENTDVSASSSGTAEVYASVSLKANANSSGDVEYTGGGEVKSNTGSSGSVHKRD
jgi:hypothetical protein